MAMVSGLGVPALVEARSMEDSCPKVKPRETILVKIFAVCLF